MGHAWVPLAPAADPILRDRRYGATLFRDSALQAFMNLKGACTERRPGVVINGLEFDS